MIWPKMDNGKDNDKENEDDGLGWLVAGLGLFLLSTLYSLPSSDNHVDHDDGDGDDDNVDYEDEEVVWSSQDLLSCLIR